jgi:DNA-binding HxlR family transcriptional regulator
MKMETNSFSEELIHLLGKTGTITILKELGMGNKRFSDLKKHLTHATLAKRLKELEKAGLIERKIIQSRPPSTEYALTSRGREVLEKLRKL